MPQLGASLMIVILTTLGVIYNLNFFIIQVTGVKKIKAAKHIQDQSCHLVSISPIFYEQLFV
jgi:hypothetical protein